MIPLFKRSVPARGRQRALPYAFSACAVLALASGSLQAKPTPSNLGNGLDRLVQSQVDMATKAAFVSGARETYAAEDGRTYTTRENAAMANLAIKDDTGRFLVRINPDGTLKIAQLRKLLKAGIGSFTATAVDKTYQGVGVMDAYVALEDMAALAQTPGVLSVILELKPRHNSITRDQALASTGSAATPGEQLTKLGTAFDQGVTQHRIDQINKYYNTSATLDYEGAGMQVGCISNSFDADTTGSSATDVSTFDLPGNGSDPVGNTTPVFVLQDDTTPGGDDEGRGMCQIVHKMAPKAKIAFATADGGEVGFANNIRGLAGLPGYTTNGQTFAADSICDDVGYYDEPFFQDGIIGFGIEDAAAAGVSYFSSAANDIGTNGYDSDTRWVPGTAASLAGTNINLSGVPANLYAGGFHNFNPNGLDVAQTVNIASNSNEPPTILQWNDPYDQNTAATGQTTIFTGSGNFTTAPVYFTITTPVTAGTKYQIVEAATNNSGFDAIVTVYKSDGTTVIVGPQDTGTDETVRFSAPSNDTGFVYEVNHYGTTTGTFSVNASSFTGFSTPSISTSLSLLVFNLSTGAYIASSSLTADATTTNEPIQLGYTYRPTGATQVQYVIARSVVPANPAFPTHVRYLIPGNGLSGIGPAEYFAYATVTTGGHAMDDSCNGCAAYSVFRPSLPEYFTSPGPVTIYYDHNDNLLSTPEVRLQPRLGFADAANTSFFVSDTTGDPDSNPNFSGTSAAGPHGAAIAALVLEANGGRRSVTPAQMTTLLESSTFPHDLDPDFATGTAKVSTGGKVTITINSDNSTSGGQGENDPNAFTVQYTGGSSLTSFVFNPGGTAATGGNVSGGNNGVTYPTTSSTTPGGTVTYFENSLPGVAFFPNTKAFTPSGVTGATASYTNASATNQYYTMSIAVPAGNMAGGSILHFTVGRGLARAATTGSVANAVTSATTGSAYYVADIFGGGVILPEGTVVSAGMTFSGTTADGGTFSGTIKNNIGAGWAKTDGYGFVNAQAAVTAPLQ